MTHSAGHVAVHRGREEERRAPAFLLAFGLAYVGAVVGYLPLLTLLLPIKLDAVAGAAKMDVLTAIVLAGAVASSLSNLGFGWLSDRSVGRGGRRRTWVAGGVIGLALSYGAIGVAATPMALLAAVVLFQIAVNAVLAPLLAIMAEEVPDAQKGIAGGLLALAFPSASALAAVLAGIDRLTEAGRLAIVPAVVVCCIVPLLLTRSRPIDRPHRTGSAAGNSRRDLVLAWSARLLVQVAASALFVYLLYLFESVSRAGPPAELATRTGWVMIAAYGIPLPIALLVGRLADRHGRPRPLLFAATAVAAIGLIAMAAADDFGGAAIAFCVYMAGTVVFLSLHASYAMQLLPDPARVGRDLGLFNLTNTLPSLVGPSLTWALSTPRDFDAVLIVLAGVTITGGLVILASRGQPDGPPRGNGDPRTPGAPAAVQPEHPRRP